MTGRRSSRARRSTNEILQLRYDAVLREAAKIQGAAAAASGSAKAQSKALAREVNELREAIGEKFQGYLRSWVGHLRDLVGFLKDDSDWLVKFAQGAMLAAGILATYALADQNHVDRSRRRGAYGRARATR